MSPNFSILADVLEMNVENVAAVVITGMVVVFIGLILLILFVSGLGIVFTKAAQSKQKKKEAVKASEEKLKASVPAPSSLPAPVVEDGIGDEVVAVIAAAVAAMGATSGKKLALKSVRTAKPQRNAWAAAGLQDNTRPFF